jgi:ADP-ribose pyrophosphatase YjhB (NUDIX family)
MIDVFGIRPRQVSRQELAQKLENENQVGIVTFLDNQLLIAANLNSWLKQSVNAATFPVFSSFFNSWAADRANRSSFFANTYRYIAKVIFPFNTIAFFVLYAAQLLCNVLHLCKVAVFTYEPGERTKLHSFDIEDTLFRVLSTSRRKKWRVMIAGHNPESLSVARTFINKLHPTLTLQEWYPHDLSLVEDVVDNRIALNANNWATLEPAWNSLAHQIQEIDMLVYQADGNEGPIVMDMLRQRGLKRGICLPPRRNRWNTLKCIWLTIIWSTLQQFTLQLDYNRPTVVNIIRDTANRYLLVKRHNYLPSDNDYSFVQGGIKQGELVTDAGARELAEEVGLKTEDLSLLESPIKANREKIYLSFIRFLALGCRYTYTENFICFGGYNGDIDSLKTNWENKGYVWIPGENVEAYLAPEKKVIWNRLETKMVEE